VGKSRCALRGPSPGHVIDLSSPAPKRGNTGGVVGATSLQPLITVTHVGSRLRWRSQGKQVQIVRTSPQESTLGSRPDGSEDGNSTTDKSSTKSLASATNASGQDDSTLVSRPEESKNGNSTIDKSSTKSYASMIDDSSTTSLATSTLNPVQEQLTWASRISESNPTRGWTVFKSRSGKL
jgi:hypothetical protein